MLSKDTDYVFRVNAENKVDAGPWTETHEAIKIKEPLAADPPVLKSKLTDLTVVAPEVATFEFKLVSGEPEAEIKWLKDHRPITTGDKYDCSYKVKNTSPKDTGTYHCFASNIISSVETSAQLTVNSKLGFYQCEVMIF